MGRTKEHWGMTRSAVFKQVGSVSGLSCPGCARGI